VIFLKSPTDRYASYVGTIEELLAKGECFDAQARLLSMQAYIAGNPQLHDKYYKFQESVYERIESMKSSGQCVDN
jgi:hypothetical protein